MDTIILPEPIKSQSDEKQYRHLKLGNGLQALLISDATLDGDDNESVDFSSDGEVAESDDDESVRATEKASKRKQAAAALCVGVGSFSDPDEIPGLAHFLEHMVFMGSAPYPNENHFDMFIKRHGGDDNAFTDCERTIFKFEINPLQLKEALKIWSQFFISPLMKKNSINREVQAVDSEFEMALVDDDTRGEQLIGIFSKAGHPIGKFLWGNKKSLKTWPAQKGIKVYNALQEFHRRYYNAKNMSLVVQSVDDLDTMQVYVEDIFKDVPNNAEGVLPHFEADVPFPDGCMISPFQLCHIIPIEQVQELRLRWFFPPQQKHFRTKPMHYLSWLVGHEGSGSLLSLLKKEHLALSVCAECSTSGFTDCSLYSIFMVQISLTDKGVAEYEKVIDFVFQYVQMLRTAGPMKRIFEEIQQIEEIDFAYAEEDIPLSYVEDLCENIPLFPPEEVISGDHLLVEYNVKVLQNVLDALLPQHCLIFYLNKVPFAIVEVQNQTIHILAFRWKGFEFWSTTVIRGTIICAADNAPGLLDDRRFFTYLRAHKRSRPWKEEWFGTIYSVISIDQEWVKKWSNAIVVHPDLSFPTPNPYIASDFGLVDDSGLTDSAAKIHSLPTKYPSCLLWFRQDTIFGLPKAFIRMHLINSFAVLSPGNSAYLDLMINILKREMAEDVYHADAASLLHSVSTSPKGGLVIKVSGYSDKLVFLLVTILQHFVELSCSNQVFEEEKLELRRSYHNLLINPKKLCKDLRLSVLEQLRSPLVDKYAASNKLTNEGFSEFLVCFRSSFHLDCLVQGNYNEKQAIQVFERSADVLMCDFLHRSEPTPERILKLNPQKTFLKVRSLNMQDDNSMITVYIQFGGASVRESSLMQLLSICMEEPCFDILRTKKQLGYSVYAMDHNTSGIIGLSVNVQTQNSKFSVEHVAEEIFRFITVDFEEVLNNMSVEDFEAQLNSLITLKTNDDSQLVEEVDRNWDEILLDDCNFDRLVQEVKHLKDFTLEILKEFYKQVCLLNQQILVVQVRGNSKIPDSPKDPVNGTSLPAEYTLEMLAGQDGQAEALHILSLQSFIKSGVYHPVSHILDAPMPFCNA